jgi:predicted ester cyclase
MSTEQNKAAVRRFTEEVLGGRNIGLADELLAPNYTNSITGSDIAKFKGFVAGYHSALSGLRFAIVGMVAEGDAVVARWTAQGTHTGSLMGESPTGKQIALRGLTYYRLANGKIVEDDPVTTPDLMQALGIQMPAQPVR